MDIKLHPQHILLGITPEPLAKARSKVIIGLIAISMVTANIIAQDMHLIRDSAKMIHAKMKRSRARQKISPFKICFE